MDEGIGFRQAESSQQTQPKTPNPIVRTGRPATTEQTSRSSAQEIDTRSSREGDANHDRTVRPVVCSQRASQTRFSRESTNFNIGDETNHDRTERPVVCSQSQRAMSNEVDIDFRIPGLPQSVVKQTENSRVRELVKKIENHPHRQDLQADLQQNDAFNPFSEKSEKMIKDMGNVELFELCETILKVQCTECLLYWNQGIVYCTCGHLLRENQSS